MCDTTPLAPGSLHQFPCNPSLKLPHSHPFLTVPPPRPHLGPGVFPFLLALQLPATCPCASCLPPQVCRAARLSKCVPPAYTPSMVPHCPQSLFQLAVPPSSSPCPASSYSPFAIPSGFMSSENCTSCFLVCVPHPSLSLHLPNMADTCSALRTWPKCLSL